MADACGQGCNPCNNNNPCMTFSSSSVSAAVSSSSSSAAASSTTAAAASFRRNNDRFIGKTDADLAKELNELTVEEREKVFDDLHGVAQVQEETPDFVSKCLNDFDKALTQLPVRQKKHLNRAFFLRPSLETDVAFKLKFLRADWYNAEKAVKRMAKFFEQKCILFGEDKLPKRITMDDLSEEDLQVFRGGYVVVLPYTDQTGRPILFCDASKINFDRMAVDNVLRCYWYLQTKAVDDDIAQKKGVLAILYSSGSLLSMSDFMGKANTLAQKGNYLITHCLPIRYSSYHFCYDDHRMEWLVHTLRAAAGSAMRLRFRAHLGSELENEYKLMTFGIRDGALLRRAQMADMSYHYQYIEKRRDIDKQQDEEEANIETTSGKGFVAYPKEKDVLIGRGHPYRDFSGNALWNTLVCENLEAYVESHHRFEKSAITMQVIKHIQEVGGRILQRTNTAQGWRILDEAASREKAAIAFRTRAKAAASSSASSSSSTSATTATSSSSSSSAVVTPTNTNTTSHKTPLSSRMDDSSSSESKRLRYDPSVGL